MHKLLRAFSLALIPAVLAFGLSACAEDSFIGDIVFSAPVTAVSYETGIDNGEPFSGVVYRKVLDYEKLLAKEKVPVLVVFLDDGISSGRAIPMMEMLADTYQKRLRILRVNVAFSDNPDDVTELIQLFEVSEYPCFAMASGGSKVGYVAGFSAGTEDTVTAMIEREIAG